MPHRLDAREPGFAAAFDEFLARPRGETADVAGIVAGILADVRARGDAAVVDHTLRLDRLALTPESMRVPEHEIEAATNAIEPSLLAALRKAAARIEAFHVRQLPQDSETIDAHGVRMGTRWSPMASVGLYVPGGRAAYPSSVLMNAIPAKVAGVGRIALCVPCPDGEVSQAVLAAASLMGLTEIYRIGGAQAVGALAYGTPSVSPVDKIIGPGNAYVAEAKRQVFGTVGIDMIAGPSEILVVADGSNDPEWVAADLLSQAEHDEAAQSILITDDAGFADAVAKAVDQQLATLPRAAIAAASWREHGAIIVVGGLDDVPTLVDRIAPEHLELCVADAMGLFKRVRHVGSVFLGPFTPEAIGDYMAGPNHVLPTYRSARFASGLSVLDFMKRTTYASCIPGSLSAIGPATMAFARAEGLEGHARSVALRLDWIAKLQEPRQGP